MCGKELYFLSFLISHWLKFAPLIGGSSSPCSDVMKINVINVCVIEDNTEKQTIQKNNNSLF